MASMKSFCKSMDRQVADMERETRAAIITKRGPYASNAADKLREEAIALSKDIDNSLAVVVEEKNNMSSFLDEMKLQFGEIVKDTLKMEDFMGQYGFKSKTPVNIEEILNWDPPVPTVTPAAAAEFCEELLEDVEEPDLAGNETDVITSEEGRPLTKTPPVQPKPSSTSDSPNFFEVGLSSLAMELYVGKSTKSKKAEQTQNPSTVTVKAPSVQQTTAAPGHVTTLQVNAVDSLCDDSLFAASPVLRLSSKLTQQQDMSNMSNISTTDSVDITPGLPSRKKASVPLSSLSAMTAGATPELPDLHWQQSSTASPDLPAVKLPVRQGHAALRPLLTASSDSPTLPDLQTVDLRKLLAGSQRVCGTAARGLTPESPQVTTLLTRGGATSKNDTPEEPKLISPSRYPPNTDTPESPQLTSQFMQGKGRRGRSESPETPVLSYQFRK